MAISCLSEDLIAAATTAGFCCIVDSPYEAVKLYLLREAAGLSETTPQELVNLSKCHICELGNIFKGTEWYLLCNVQGVVTGQGILGEGGEEVLPE